METDRQLVVRTAAGDHAAAAELWARFAPRLIGLARALLGIGARADDTPAQDVVQDVFLRVVRLDRRSAEAIADCWAYLAAATRHAVLNASREEGRRRRREHAAARPEHTAPWDGGDAELLDAIAALSAEERELLALKHFAGLTFDQMATVLQQPRGTVAGRYRSAMERLTDRLAKPHPEPSHA